MRNKLKESEFLMAILLAPFIRPNGTNAIIPGSQYIYDALSLASLLLLLVLYLKQQSNKKIKASDRQLMYGCLMFLCIMVTTIKNHQDALVHLRVSVTCVGIMFFVKVFSKYPKSLISISMFELEVLIYINALCLILFPGGMYLSNGTFGKPNNWFMGYDNHWFVFYYGAYYLSIINLQFGGSKVRSGVLLTVLHVTTLRVMSGVLVFGILSMDFLFFFKVYRSRLFNLRNILLVGMMLTALLVFFATNETIQYFIKSVLNKEDSMSARGRIWMKALALFQNNPVFGNGRWFEVNAVELYGLPAGVNAHNMWIEILFEGGVIGICSFILVIIAAYGKRNTMFYRLTLVPIATAFIAMSVDAMIDTRGVMLFYLLAIASNSERFESAVLTKHKVKHYKAL